MSKTQPISLGILGGGQLARMLALAAAPLGITPRVLSESSSDPAAQVAPAWQQGNPRNEADLQKIMGDCQALTFESEFFDMAVIKKVAEALPSLHIFPHPDIMARIQDRRTQKAFLDEFKVPTAAWVPLETSEDLELAVDQLKFPFVVKKATGGYDGYGTFYIRNATDLKNFQWPGPCIAEKAIGFKRELAVMLFRSRAGQIRIYPLVETRQKDSRCDLVLGPLKHRSLTPLLKRLQSGLNKTNYVGALGVEMFDTGRELLVNELAPRVHNSGHYSQNALNFDQFTLHVLCGLQDRLPEIKAHGKAFAMANLLGEENFEFNLGVKLETALHWYGKGESRPGRKMGHLNASGNDTKTLLKLVQRERKSMLVKKTEGKS